jgi:endonuclease/exonuclease/phosphatase (EEP) superfamily protein YafD
MTSDRSAPLKLAERTAVLGLVGVALLSGAGYLAGLHRLLELTSHFRPQYFAVACLLLLIFAWRRRPVWTVLAAVTAAANVVWLLPHALSEAAADAERTGPTLRLLLANVQYSNFAHQAFSDLVIEHQPDVIVVEELTPAWKQGIGPLRERYPNGKLFAREGAFGIGVLSRLPLQSAEVVDLGDPDYPAIAARVAVGGRPLLLLAAHPPPPTSDTLFAIRNRQLKELGRRALELNAPTVVLGDLNISPWSPYFSALLHNARLTSARDGFGILPTWPSFFAPAMIPIDHCLVSRGARVLNVETGPDIGSDHLPLVIDLRLN